MNRENHHQTLPDLDSEPAGLISRYLDNGGTLENAQTMANHASARTTQLYDRPAEEVTLDEVERILV